MNLNDDFQTTLSLLSIDEFKMTYCKVREVGRGKFGVVFEVKAKDEQDPCLQDISYAAKHIRARKRDVRSKVYEEIRILKQLESPHILKFIGAYENKAEIVLVTEFLNGGELFERVSSDQFELTESEAAHFVEQICHGIEYIHSKNVVHLDLKPENIVCCHPDSNTIKIIDFGLARLINPGEETKAMCGTPEFVPPEVCNYDPVSCASDIWSLGVITYVLLSGLSPFMGESVAETYSNIVRVEYDFDEPEFDVISEDAKNFISALLVKNPKKRLSASECLNHQWLRGVKSEKLRYTSPICKTKLRKFLARRRWQRCGQAIRAMTRMSGLMVRRRSSQNVESPETELTSLFSNCTSPARSANQSPSLTEIPSSLNYINSLASTSSPPPSLIEDKDEHDEDLDTSEAKGKDDEDDANGQRSLTVIQKGSQVLETININDSAD